MPHSRKEKEPLREEPGAATFPESADEQDQDGPRGHSGKAFLEHAKEAIDEHHTPGRLLAQ